MTLSGLCKKWEKGGTWGAFKNIDIVNQVKLRALLSKYWALIYRQDRAQTTITKVGTSGQEASVCIVWYSMDKCCGLYELNNRE